MSLKFLTYLGVLVSSIGAFMGAPSDWKGFCFIVVLYLGVIAVNSVDKGVYIK